MGVVLPLQNSQAAMKQLDLVRHSKTVCLGLRREEILARTAATAVDIDGALALARPLEATGVRPLAASTETAGEDVQVPEDIEGWREWVLVVLVLTCSKA
jgi:hypothetical protein